MGGGIAKYQPPLPRFILPENAKVMVPISDKELEQITEDHTGG